MSQQADDGMVFALVCLKTGSVLSLLEGGTEASALDPLAAAAPELFRVGAGAELGPLFRRLGSDDRSDSFQEIVLLSQRRAYVVQRLVTRPVRALVAMSDDASKLAHLLSGVHRYRQELEARP